MAELSILMPCYNGAATLETAIESALAQEDVATEIIISVDPSTDETAAVAARYAGRKNVSVTEQPERLGWVGNSNWLIGRVATPYLVPLGQDDHLHPRLGRTLIDRLKADPGAAIASPLIVNTDGTVRRRKRETRGTRFQRMQAGLADPLGACDIKGVARAEPFRAGLRYRPSRFMDYRRDHVLQLELLVAGHHLSVDAPLYIKSAAPDTLSAKWNATYRGEDYFAPEADLRATLIDVILAADLTRRDKHALVSLVLARLDPPAFAEDPVDKEPADAHFVDWPVRLAAGVILSRAEGPDAGRLAPDAGARSALAQSFATVAQTARNAKHTDLADAAARTALLLEPDNATGLRLHSHLLLDGLRTGAFRDRAVQNAKIWVRKAPRNSHAWELLARAELNAGNLEAARNACHQAVVTAATERPSLKALQTRLAGEPSATARKSPGAA